MATKTITIEGPVKPGALIPRPPKATPRAKQGRFYNFPPDWVPPVRNKMGRVIEPAKRPRGVAFKREVPDDEWHRALVRCGDVRIVTSSAPAKPKPTPPVKPAAGGDK